MSECIAAHQRLLFNQNQLVYHKYYSSAPAIRPLSLCINTPFPFLPNPRFLQTTAQNPPKCSSKSSRRKNPFLLPFQVLLPSLIFLVALLFLRVLPRDLPLRWRHLVTFSEKAEAAGARLPSHVWQAVIACEDRRFFSHCGIDIVGILRAILLYPDGGGGSTITQQVGFLTPCLDQIFSVVNFSMMEYISVRASEECLPETRTEVFKKSRRNRIGTYIRTENVKMENIMFLSKQGSVFNLGKIYWGHGLYGLEAASAFYFRKHPSLLSLGESAMLAGIIPLPERRSPLKDPSGGKTSQARALRRMVKAGFLDLRTALLVVNQPLCLHVDESNHANGFTHGAYSSFEERGKSKELIGKISDNKEIWNWERASAVWKVREDMGEWATKIMKRSA